MLGPLGINVFWIIVTLISDLKILIDQTYLSHYKGLDEWKMPKVDTLLESGSE